MKTKYALFMLFYMATINSTFSSVKIERNINYSSSLNGDRNLLDLYYPKDIQTPKTVLVFIHGGSWNSGKKGTYWWMGRNFASKNVVTVIINYSLSPKYQYEQMASDCAEAIKWVKNNPLGEIHFRIFIFTNLNDFHNKIVLRIEDLNKKIDF